MKRSRTSPPRPTQAELGILRVLWQRGPSSVREVHDALAMSREAGYTTVLKLLQIMAVKGLVARDDSERTHVYRAALPQTQTQQQLIRDLVERAFDGSAGQLVLQALATRRATPEEMDAIRAMLDRAEEQEP
jgi:predicted transcriptional regulator